MSEKEKALVESLTQACDQLPEEKREFLLGFAEGVAAMAKKKEQPPVEERPAS